MDLGVREAKDKIYITSYEVLSSNIICGRPADPAARCWVLNKGFTEFRLLSAAVGQDWALKGWPLG